MQTTNYLNKDDEFVVKKILELYNLDSLKEGYDVTVFSPASMGNFGSAFDEIGVGLRGPGDLIQAKKVNDKGVKLEVFGPEELKSPEKNLAYQVADKIYKKVNPKFGIELILYKGIPLTGGFGGSAASSTAAAVAVNKLLGEPLSKEQILGLS